jgi:hypothetical protein
VTRATWEARTARYWAEHPHRCHACGRPVDPLAKTGALVCNVHHLCYDYPHGYEPDAVLVGLCASCHDEWRCNRARCSWSTKLERRCKVRHLGRSLHSTHRRYSRRRGWMAGPNGSVSDARHHRSLWWWSILWIKRERIYGWLTWGPELPPWSAPSRRQAA